MLFVHRLHCFNYVRACYLLSKLRLWPYGAWGKANLLKLDRSRVVKITLKGFSGVINI